MKTAPIFSFTGVHAPMRRLALTLALLLTSLLPARPELVNVANRAVPSTNRDLWAPGNWNIQRLVDGDTSVAFHLDVAPESGAAYQIDLGRATTVTELRIFPRQDGCCPERLQQIRVSIHADAGGSPGTETWGTDLFTDGSNAGSGPGTVVSVKPPAPVSGQWIQILSLEDPVQNYALQISELEIWADVPANEVNRALNTLVRTSEPLYAGRSPAALVDGNRGTADPQVLHGPEIITPPYFYEVNLGTEVALSRIVLWARQDSCCPERLSNYRLSVHPDAQGNPGPAAWSADLRTDGSSPGSEPGSRDEWTAGLDPAGAFRGQWIRIQALDEPPLPYSLQIVEIEAFGETSGVGSILLTRHPASATGAVGQTTQFSVAATIAGGDPALLTYQWQRNGSDLPGATQATYTTPILTVLDDKAVYRCIVSYPGRSAVTSDPATLRINLAYQANASSNRGLWAPGGWNIAMLTDGNRQGVFHLDTEPESGAAYQIDLGAEVTLEQIALYPRQDGCCPERLSNFRVSVHRDNAGALGDVVWHSDFFTDGTNPGATSGSIVQIPASADPTGTFRGQWIRIESLEEPIQNYALQMTELEVFGSYSVQSPVLQIATEPSDYGTAPGRTVRFTVNARVLNGDPALITYQWQKNGVDIPGATEASYTSGPVPESDANTKYRVILSYPNAASLTSREALVLFDFNYAKGQPATSNRPLWPPGGWNIAMLTDGDRRGVFHLDQFSEPGAAYLVDLGGEVEIESIDLFPRQDGCCPERLTHFRVSVHPAADQPGDPVWQADLHSDGSDPGSFEGAVVKLTRELDPSGTFTGRWVRLLSLDDPIPPYGLQMTELEVYGRWTGPIDVPIQLTFSRSGTSLVLQWPSGTLESAPAATGPFATLPGATSPLTIATGNAAAFYRVRR